ncbi:hypothetical protein BDN67DRAFT_986156, partial [Paxillus ammoniavirescens]
MGRPKLYHTEDDKQCAMRGYHKTYYEKQTGTDSDVQERLRAPPSSSAQKTPKNQVSLRQSTTVREIKAVLMVLIENSRSSFLDHFIFNLVHSPSPSSCFKTLNITLKQVENMAEDISSLHAEVLQERGVGLEVQRVEVTSHRLREVIHALEDILLHSGSEPPEALLRRQ